MQSKAFTSALVCFIAAGVIFSSGCATSRKAGWEDDAAKETLSAAEAGRIRRAAMSHWANRDNREDLEEALEAFERLARSTRSDYETLVYLSRGYYLLADGHREDMEEGKKFWETGLSWGELALATNKSFHQKVVVERKDWEEALPGLTENEVAALYWSAVNLGKWAKNSNIATMLKYKSRIKDMITRVGELDPDFFYGAVPRYWGVYYAVAPGFAGGDMDKSKVAFRESLKLANNYLATHVLYAENWATREDDRELFKKELNFVLNADPEAIAAVAPENRIEQRKAREMLENIDEHF